jgi:hypothetical protein
LTRAIDEHVDYVAHDRASADDDRAIIVGAAE